jgi:hypothetical protein
VVNRPKAIGTAGESAVVAFLRTHGFPGAERRALAGSLDLGDITGCGPLVIECKAGKTAESASSGVILQWLAETRTETRNAGADYGLLVTKRAGRGSTRTGDWWVYMDSPTLFALAGLPGPRLDMLPLATVRVTLAEAVALLRHAGYGDELSAA